MGRLPSPFDDGSPSPLLIPSPFPSPYIGSSPSPFLKSRGATPSVPLQKVDELAGEDFPGDSFELGPPALPLEEHVPVCSQSKLPQALSPLWPTTPPSLAQLEEKNTFLNFYGNCNYNASPLICSRQRALSDFAGSYALGLKSKEILDDFPLPEPEMSPPEKTVPQTLESCPQEHYWYDDHFSLGLEHEAVWSEHDRGLQSFSVQRFPPPPPMPQGDHVYKPHWAYGSTWPFNCAPTTLILEDLPGDLAQQELMQVLDAEGFNGLYDFVFLPASVRTGRSSRYAVINFSRHSYGLLLAAHFHNRTAWKQGKYGPCCKVYWSLHLQGLTALLEHYRNDANMHDCVPVCMQPAAFFDGWRVPMPMPTKPIRIPSTGGRPRSMMQKEYAEPVAVARGSDQMLQIDSAVEFPLLGCSPPQQRSAPHLLER